MNIGIIFDTKEMESCNIPYKNNYYYISIQTKKIIGYNAILMQRHYKIVKKHKKI